MQNIARHLRRFLPHRRFSSRAAESTQPIEFRLSLHNAPAVSLKGRQPWAALHCSDGITSIALCGESRSLATLHFNGAVRLWSLDGEVPREADGSLDCLRSRAHYLETEVIPVGGAAMHDGSLLHADAAPRVIVLQPNNLAVWGAKKFELQPATSAARSHGVFHDRIKTLYSVFESSKKGSDLQMTACHPDVSAQITPDVPPSSPSDSVFVQIVAPAGCSSALALRRDGCVMAVPVPDKLETIDQSDNVDARDTIENAIALPLFSLLALESGTGRLCSVQGSSSIVAIAGRERGSSECIVALNVHAAGDGSVHAAAALLGPDNNVSWATASLPLTGPASPALAASRATSAVFKLGHSVAEAPLLREGQPSLLLEDDGRARVKQVVGNSLITAALLDGNLLLAWRAR